MKLETAFCEYLIHVKLNGTFLEKKIALYLNFKTFMLVILNKFLKINYKNLFKCSN